MVCGGGLPRGFAAVGLCGRCACGRGALRECARCRCA